MRLVALADRGLSQPLHRLFYHPQLNPQEFVPVFLCTPSGGYPEWKADLSSLSAGDLGGEIACGFAAPSALLRGSSYEYFKRVVQDALTG